MRNKKFILLFCILCFISQLNGKVCADPRPIVKGDRFPDVIFKNSISKEEQAYLAISRKKTFSFREIRGSFIIIEVFSTYCYSCPRNVPILNKVYSTVGNDPKLKGTVKVFSIAVGNNQNEVKNYTKEHKVLYPVLTDLNFNAHKALGNPRVPYTIFVKRDAKGKNIVIYTHQGVLETADSVMNQVRNFL